MAEVTYLGRSFTSNTVYTTTYSQVTTVRQTGWEWGTIQATGMRRVRRSVWIVPRGWRRGYYSFQWVWERFTFPMSIYGIWRVTENRTVATVIATTYTTATDSYESLLKKVEIPYIRQKTIYFICQGLRPFCAHNVYFDGTNVNPYITRIVGATRVEVPYSYWNGRSRIGGTWSYTTPATDNGALVTNDVGFCSGYFYLPAGTFKTGERVFRVTDAVTDDGDWSSMAFTTYTAKGILETRQQTNITSLYSVNSSAISSTSTINSSSAQLLVAFPWGDPIAQTFRVENSSSSGTGAFITGIEIWIQSKDPVIPLTMQVRDSDNGYPGLKVLRTVTLEPAQISIGLDKPTFFRLDRPLYIENMLDYAIVLLANSQKYNVYVCTLGQNQLLFDPSNVSRSNVFTTPAAVSKQPYLGSFFMSQNGTTWTADQMTDMAFRVYRAEFETSAQYFFHAANPAPIGVGGSILHTTAGSNLVYVEFAEHGFGVDSSITPSWWSYADLKCEDLASAGLIATDITGIRQIASVDENGFTFIAGKNATATGVWDVGYLEIAKNAKADIVHPICGAEAPSGTAVKYHYKSTTGQNIGGGQHMYQKDLDWIEYIPNQDLMFNAPRLIASAANENQGMSGAKSFEQRITIETSNPMITPVIDLSKIGVTTISHVLNNPTVDNETSVSEGLAQARYISKSVTLENPATSLRLIVAANIVAGNSIAAYYRFVSPENTSPISSIPWSELPGNVSKLASVREQFIDYTFEDVGITPFTTYQVKIVMKGINSAIPPIIKDVRTMALAV